MLDKLIQFEEVCFTTGRPTGLGFILLIILVIIAGVGYAIKKK